MKSQLKRYLGSLVFVFLLCLSIALGATAGVLFVYNSDLPQVNSLEDRHPSLITEVYSDDGRVIGSFALERRIIVTWDEIPQVLYDSITSVEDQNFRTHWGIDFYGVARAGLKDLMAGRWVEGGSTLTQQLSKNLFLTPERTLRRKVQEAMLGPKVLDVPRFPAVVFRSTRLAGQAVGRGVYDLRLAGELSVRGVARPLTLPLRVELADGRLVASGHTTLLQSAFGIQPISVAGMVKVKDEVAIDFQIVARQQD